VNDRRVLSGIIHALKCGGRWVDCADVYGPKKTLYNRFVRWAEHGIWEDIFSALAGTQDTPDRLIIDSSCIKVHRAILPNYWFDLADKSRGNPPQILEAPSVCRGRSLGCRLYSDFGGVCSLSRRTSLIFKIRA
jgi:transposase